jgi:hypothetical protein
VEIQEPELGFAFANPVTYYGLMSVKELASEVRRLSPAELAAFGKWFEEFAAASNQHNDPSGWADFAAKGLARAYSDAEPDYTLSDVKR